MEDRVQQFGRPDWGLGRQVSLGAICGSHRAAWKLLAESGEMPNLQS